LALLPRTRSRPGHTQQWPPMTRQQLRAGYSSTSNPAVSKNSRGCRTAGTQRFSRMIVCREVSGSSSTDCSVGCSWPTDELSLTLHSPSTQLHSWSKHTGFILQLELERRCNGAPVASDEPRHRAGQAAVTGDPLKSTWPRPFSALNDALRSLKAKAARTSCPRPREGHHFRAGDPARRKLSTAGSLERNVKHSISSCANHGKCVKSNASSFTTGTDCVCELGVTIRATKLGDDSGQIHEMFRVRSFAHRTFARTF